MATSHTETDKSVQQLATKGHEAQSQNPQQTAQESEAVASKLRGDRPSTIGEQSDTARPTDEILRTATVFNELPDAKTGNAMAREYANIASDGKTVRNETIAGPDGKGVAGSTFTRGGQEFLVTKPSEGKAPEVYNVDRTSGSAKLSLVGDKAGGETKVVESKVGSVSSDKPEVAANPHNQGAALAKTDAGAQNFDRKDSALVSKDATVGSQQLAAVQKQAMNFAPEAGLQPKEKKAEGSAIKETDTGKAQQGPGSLVGQGNATAANTGKGSEQSVAANAEKRADGVVSAGKALEKPAEVVVAAKGAVELPAVKADLSKPDSSKVDSSKIESNKVEANKVEANKVETPKAEISTAKNNAEVVKSDAGKQEAVKDANAVNAGRAQEAQQAGKLAAGDSIPKNAEPVKAVVEGQLVRTEVRNDKPEAVSGGKAQGVEGFKEPAGKIAEGVGQKIESSNKAEQQPKSDIQSRVVTDGADSANKGSSAFKSSDVNGQNLGQKKDLSAVGKSPSNLESTRQSIPDVGSRERRIEGSSGKESVKESDAQPKTNLNQSSQPLNQGATSSQQGKPSQVEAGAKIGEPVKPAVEVPQQNKQAQVEAGAKIGEPVKPAGEVPQQNKQAQIEAGTKIGEPVKPAVEVPQQNKQAQVEAGTKIGEPAKPVVEVPQQNKQAQVEAGAKIGEPAKQAGEVSQQNKQAQVEAGAKIGEPAKQAGEVSQQNKQAQVEAGVKVGEPAKQAGELPQQNKQAQVEAGAKIGEPVKPVGEVSQQGANARGELPNKVEVQPKAEPLRGENAGARLESNRASGSYKGSDGVVHSDNQKKESASGNDASGANKALPETPRQPLLEGGSKERKAEAGNLTNPDGPAKNNPANANTPGVSQQQGQGAIGGRTGGADGGAVDRRNDSTAGNREPIGLKPDVLPKAEQPKMEPANKGIVGDISADKAQQLASRLTDNQGAGLRGSVDNVPKTTTGDQSKGDAKSLPDTVRNDVKVPVGSELPAKALEPVKQSSEPGRLDNKVGDVSTGRVLDGAKAIGEGQAARNDQVLKPVVGDIAVDKRQDLINRLEGGNISRPTDSQIPGAKNSVDNATKLPVDGRLDGKNPVGIEQPGRVGDIPRVPIDGKLPVGELPGKGGDVVKPPVDGRIDVKPPVNVEQPGRVGDIPRVPIDGKLPVGELPGKGGDVVKPPVDGRIDVKPPVNVEQPGKVGDIPRVPSDGKLPVGEPPGKGGDVVKPPVDGRIDGKPPVGELPGKGGDVVKPPVDGRIDVKPPVGELPGKGGDVVKPPVDGRIDVKPPVGELPGKGGDVVKLPVDGRIDVKPPVGELPGKGGDVVVKPPVDGRIDAKPPVGELPGKGGDVVVKPPVDGRIDGKPPVGELPGKGGDVVVKPSVDGRIDGKPPIGELPGKGGDVVVKPPVDGRIDGKPPVGDLPGKGGDVVVKPPVDGRIDGKPPVGELPGKGGDVVVKPPVDGRIDGKPPVGELPGKGGDVVVKPPVDGRIDGKPPVGELPGKGLEGVAANLANRQMEAQKTPEPVLAPKSVDKGVDVKGSEIRVTEVAKSLDGKAGSESIVVSKPSDRGGIEPSSNKPDVLSVMKEPVKGPETARVEPIRESIQETVRGNSAFADSLLTSRGTLVNADGQLPAKIDANISAKPVTSFNENESGKPESRSSKPDAPVQQDVGRREQIISNQKEDTISNIKLETISEVGDSLATSTAVTREEDADAVKKELEELKLKEEKKKELEEKEEATNARNAMIAAMLAQRKQQKDEKESLLQNDEKNKKKDDGKRRRYVVKEKDTLDSIAKKQLRDIRLAALIYEINKHTLPVKMEKGKQIVELRPGSSIWLPADTEIQEFRGRLYASPKGTSAVSSSSGKDKGSFVSAEDELEARFGQDWDGSSKAADGILGAAVAKNQSRRANIERILGPISNRAAETGRIRYIVRLSDTLEGVAAKHPALKDASLWPLLARLNKMSEDVDDDGRPISSLKRGMVLDLPTPLEIDLFKNPPEDDFDNEEEEVPTGKSFTEIVSRSQIETAAPESTTPTTPYLDPGSPQETKSVEVVKVEEVAAETVFSASESVEPEKLVPEKVEGSVISQVKVVSPPSPIPVAQAPVPTSPAPAPVVSPPVKAAPPANVLAAPPQVVGGRLIWALDRSVRLVKSAQKWDPAVGVFRSQLELLLGGVWYPVVFYEVLPESSVRHEYAPGGRRKSVNVDLPAVSAQELADNDLLTNWKGYCQRYVSFLPPAPKS